MVRQYNGISQTLLFLREIPTQYILNLCIFDINNAFDNQKYVNHDFVFCFTKRDTERQYITSFLSLVALLSRRVRLQKLFLS